MASQTPSSLAASVQSSTASERALLALLANPETSEWLPLAGPQIEAYLSDADELFYGGAAGGGKTDLILGLVLTAHKRSIIFRREFPQLTGITERMTEIRGGTDGFNSQRSIWRLGGGRVLELGAVQHETDVSRYQGRPHDLKAFDEITHFTEKQYRFLIGWNRTTLPGQRSRVVVAGNPPTDPEGEWVVVHWAPWLDPDHPNRAMPGELRWFAMLDGVDTEVAGPETIEHTNKDGESETITPRSRTFIPAKVEDNPFLMAAGYKSTLQSLPEPLRTAMLKGIFGSKAEDNRWQVIPSDWIDQAMSRWTPDAPGTLDTLGVDVARGGKDKTVLAPRHGLWFGPLEKHEGSTTPDGPTVAALAVNARNGQGVINIDIIGVGGSAYDSLQAVDGLAVNPLNGASASVKKDRSGKLGFVNKRAEWYWKLREDLDPDHGIGLALPPDRELRSDLCAARWKLTPRGIQIEAKEDIVKRIGRSPDCADAVVYANAREKKAAAGFSFGGVKR